MLIVAVVIVVIFLLLNMSKKDNYYYDGININNLGDDIDVIRDNISKKCKLCLLQEDNPINCKSSCLEHTDSYLCDYCKMFSEHLRKCFPYCVRPT